MLADDDRTISARFILLFIIFRNSKPNALQVLSHSLISVAIPYDNQIS